MAKFQEVPTLKGMLLFRNNYILDIAPNPPNVNTVIGPKVGDTKITILVGDEGVGNVFNFLPTRVNFSENT